MRAFEARLAGAEKGNYAAVIVIPGWTIFEVTPEYIDRIIDEYNRDRAAAHERYLRRKQAWLERKTVSSEGS
jgi:hypothetical protein